MGCGDSDRVLSGGGSLFAPPTLPGPILHLPSIVLFVRDKTKGCSTISSLMWLSYPALGVLGSRMVMKKALNSDVCVPKNSKPLYFAYNRCFIIMTG